jgi:choline-glycine betaine transporter
MHRWKVIHAVIGIAVSLVGTPLLGGGISGYLEGPDLKSGGVFGLIVGGIAGGFYVIGMLSIFILNVPSEFRVGVGGWLLQFVLRAGITALLFALFSGGLGGLLGSYIAKVQQQRQISPSTG